MSDRLIRVLILGIALALCPRPGSAQDVAEMGRAVDSLRDAAALARKALDDYRASRPATVDKWADSMVAGAGRITVYFNEDVARIARAGVTRADQLLAQLGSARASIPEMRFSIVSDRQGRDFDPAGREMVNVRLHRSTAAPINNTTPETVDGIAAVIVHKAAEKAGDRAAGAIARWRRHELPLGADDGRSIDWGAVRLNLVSNPSLLGRTCYRGDIRACRMLFGLEAVPDPLMTWYDSAGRSAVIAAQTNLASRTDRQGTRRCLDGDDGACVTVLRLMMPEIVPPSSSFARNALIAHALNVGGDRAAERLLTTNGSVADALSAAAGMPVDALLQDWQAKLRSQAEAANTLPTSIAVAALFWIAGFTMLSLRGSRWR